MVCVNREHQIVYLIFTASASHACRADATACFPVDVRLTQFGHLRT